MEKEAKFKWKENDFFPKEKEKKEKKQKKTEETEKVVLTILQLLKSLTNHSQVNITTCSTRSNHLRIFLNRPFWSRANSISTI